MSCSQIGYHFSDVKFGPFSLNSYHTNVFFVCKTIAFLSQIKHVL